VDQDIDAELLGRLRAGDERAFVILVQRHHEAMLRLACSFVPNAAVAEEVVQDTWLGVLRGLSGFEERSSSGASAMARSWQQSAAVPARFRLRQLGCPPQLLAGGSKGVA
jgi:hypothetical protein